MPWAFEDVYIELYEITASSENLHFEDN